MPALGRVQGPIDAPAALINRNKNEPTQWNATLQKVALFGVALGLGLLFVSVPIGGAVTLVLALFFYLVKTVDSESVKNFNHGTKLHAAVYKGNEIVVQWLLFLGANPNYPECSGNSSLHWAAKEGRLSILKQLIEAGGDVDLYGERARVPLHDAINKKRDDIVECLLEAGANPNLRNWDRLSPLETAREALQHVERRRRQGGAFQIFPGDRSQEDQERSVERIAEMLERAAR